VFGGVFAVFEDDLIGDSSCSVDYERGKQIRRAIAEFRGYRANRKDHQLVLIGKIAFEQSVKLYLYLVVRENEKWLDDEEAEARFFERLQPFEG